MHDRSGLKSSPAQVISASITGSEHAMECAEEQEAELEICELLLARATQEHFDTNCVHFNLTLGHSEKE